MTRNAREDREKLIDVSDLQCIEFDIPELEIPEIEDITLELEIPNIDDELIELDKVLMDIFKSD